MIPVHKYLQREAYRRMWRDIERKRRHERFIAGPLGWIVEVPHVLTNPYFVITVVVLLSMAFVLRSLAQTQVPPACVVLAAREGQPIETQEQIRLARVKLWFMKRHGDPLVRDCRAAIRRLKADQ